MDSFSSVFEGASAFLASDPSVLAMQIAMISLAFLVVYLILFVTRDIILRTHSFLYQVGCILLTALLPIVGFFLYLLIRPSTTLFERTLDHKVGLLLARMQGGKKPEQKQEKPQKKA